MRRAGEWRALGLCAALLVLATAIGAEAHAQTMFRGDARRSGIADGAAPRHLPAVKWRFVTGDRIAGSAVAADGVVYVGSDDGNVYAVEAASGLQRWVHRTGGPVPGTPAVAGAHVYVTSYDGRIRALDRSSGALVWSFRTGGERRFEARGLHGWQPKHQTYADPFDVFLSSPAVVDGVVYVGSGDGHVYALSAADGTLRWRFDTGEVVHASPAVAQGLVVVGSWNGRLYALDAKSGAERWRFQGGVDALIGNQQGFQSSPTVRVEDGAGTVYVGSRDAHLYALDLATGRELWRHATNASWVVSSPLVHGGRVHFATSDSSLVVALAARDGAPAWQHEDEAYMFSSPVAAGDVLLIGVLNGTLAARDLATGRVLWRWQTQAARDNPGWALTRDGRLNSAMLYASPWRERPLAAVERQYAVGAIFATPLVVDGVIYVGSADGALYALE